MENICTVEAKDIVLINNKKCKMKKLFLMLVVSGLFGITMVSAQVNARSERGVSDGIERTNDFRGEHKCMIPGLTSEQQQSIDKLRTVHLKKVSQLRADLQEKKARLQSLRVADTYNEKEINKIIDDMAAVRADLMKENEDHRQKVKALLNDDQKEWFDSRPMNNRRGDGSCYFGHNSPNRRGDGNGRGFNRGYGRGNRF